MNIIFSVLRYGLWVLDTVFFYKILTYFVSPKSNKLLKLSSIVGSFFLVGIMIFPEDIANVVGGFILFLLIMLLCFKDGLVQRISVVLILFPLIIAVNFLTDNIGLQTYLAFGGILAEDMANTVVLKSNYAILDGSVHLFYNIIQSGFWFLLYLLLQRRLPNVKKLLTNGMWGVICIICLAPLSGIISLVLFTPKASMLVYPAMFSSIITIVGILLLTGYIADTVTTKMENKNLRLQETYYNELETSQKNTAKLRHDMNNHLGVISTFIKNGDREKAEDYYNVLSGELLTTTRVFCKNSIVNAVINAKYNKAVSEEIDCFFNIDLGNNLPIDDISLCSIFANSLDNAVEACHSIERSSKRKISLKARYLDGYFSYEIINTKSNPIIEENGIVMTNKKDRKNHGYGLSSIDDIVKSYNGDIGISHTESEFILNILISLL